MRPLKPDQLPLQCMGRLVHSVPHYSGYMFSRDTFQGWIPTLQRSAQGRNWERVLLRHNFVHLVSRVCNFKMKRSYKSNISTKLQNITWFLCRLYIFLTLWSGEMPTRVQLGDTRNVRRSGGIRNSRGAAGRSSERASKVTGSESSVCEASVLLGYSHISGVR